MKTLFIFLLPAVIATLLSGCVTGPSPEEVRRDADMQKMAQKVMELQERVGVVQQENQAIGRDIEDLKAANRNAGSSTQARIDALEKQMQTLQRARAEDRSAIVNDISRKVQGMVGGSSKSSSGSSDSGSSDYGYEHIVKSGETLSAIAKAYGVSMSSIRKANRMKDDRVRIGQKLFIPEKK